ncbi:programmed cell death antitoxin maze [hydrocarbon metagenome]|uniref:Programmed cell death antitoxin maze n=1 Tax=hydrocarbon metagenome TaxID=938273 RepID=A0A0W8FM50_9ZZZZ
MEVTIQKWGNSLAIRIPGSYAKDINLKQGTCVDLRKKADKIEIVPRKTKLNLRDLLSKITDENIHEEEFAGDGVGKEIW